MMSTTPGPVGYTFQRHFQLSRWIRLLRVDLVQYRNPLYVAIVAVYGAVLFALVVLAPTSGSWQPHKIFLPSIICLGGMILVGNSFAELGDPVRRAAFLLIPASTLEKLGARLVLTLVAFPLAAISLYWITSLLGAAIGHLVWDSSFDIYDPFTQEIGRLIVVYPLIHSVFFLGSVWFRKSSIFKTIISVVVVQISFSIIAVFIFRIVFYDFFQGVSFDALKELQLHIDPGTWLTSDSSARLGTVFTYLLFGPWLWVIAYFRLADTESN